MEDADLIVVTLWPTEVQFAMISDHCLHKMGQSERTVESERSTGSVEPGFVDQHDESLRLHFLLWHSRRHCRSNGQSAYRQRDSLYSSVTSVSRCICYVTCRVLFSIINVIKEKTKNKKKIRKKKYKKSTNNGQPIHENCMYEITEAHSGGRIVSSPRKRGITTSREARRVTMKGTHRHSGIRYFFLLQNNFGIHSEFVRKNIANIPRETNATNPEGPNKTKNWEKN